MNNNYTSILICNDGPGDPDGPYSDQDGEFISVNGERKGVDTLPNEIQAKFNANRMWSLANNIRRVTRGLTDSELNKAYIGLIKEHGHVEHGEIMLITEINFVTDFVTDRTADDEKYFLKFYENTKELLKIWPSTIEFVLLVLDFGDTIKSFNDEDFLLMTHISKTNIKAAVFDEGVNNFVVQGYDNGEYDTGYYSCEEDELYLSDRNRFIVSLQDQKFMDSFIGNIC